MGVISAYRSSQTNLWYNSAGQPGVMTQIRAAATTPLALASVTSEVGVFGTTYLDKASPSVARSPQWPGFQNCPGSGGPFAILCRIIPRWSGAPASFDMLNMQASNANRGGLFDFVVLSSGAFRLAYIDADGQTGSTSVTSTSFYTGYVAGTAVDLMVSWDGTTNANSLSWGVNGVLLQSQTPGVAAYNISQLIRTGIIMGNGANAALANFDINEFVIFNNAQSVVYTTRVGFWPVSAFDASSYTDPGIANVLSGVNYTQAGVAETGTLVSTDPGQGNVLSGVGYTINNSAKTGSLVSTDPGVSNVLLGVTYTINGVLKTGTLVSTDPGVANVLAPTAYTINNVLKTGTLGASTDPGVGNVANGVAYTINGVAKVGTLNSVTNVIQAGTLVGQSLNATLVGR